LFNQRNNRGIVASYPTSSTKTKKGSLFQKTPSAMSAFIQPPPQLTQQKWYSTTGDIDPWVPIRTSSKQAPTYLEVVNDVDVADDSEQQEASSVPTGWSNDWNTPANNSLGPNLPNKQKYTSTTNPPHQEIAWSNDWDTPFAQKNDKNIDANNAAFNSNGSASGRYIKGKRNVDIEEELGQQNLYKTELCRSWVETGSCRYGTKCQFAHGEQELRPIMRHPKYKTEICKTFHTQGTCPYGTRCRFIHYPSERNMTSPATVPLEEGAVESPPADTSAAPLLADPVSQLGEIFVNPLVPVSVLPVEEHASSEQTNAPPTSTKVKNKNKGGSKGVSRDMDKLSIEDKKDKKKKKKTRLPIFRFLASDKV